MSALVTFGCEAPAARLLLELVRQEIKAMVDGGTLADDPARFDELASLQLGLTDALA